MIDEITKIIADSDYQMQINRITYWTKTGMITPEDYIKGFKKLLYNIYDNGDFTFKQLNSTIRLVEQTEFIPIKED